MESKSNIEIIRLEKSIETRVSVFQNFSSGDDISVSLIQRKCRCGYNSAYMVFEMLVEDDLIERGPTSLGKMR